MTRRHEQNIPILSPISLPRNQLFHEEQLPTIGWMFSHASTSSLQVKTFTQNKNNNNNNGENILVYRF